MIDEGPGEHDAHLMDEDEPDTVKCVSCRRWISAHTEQCPHCGVYFAGEAWQQQIAGEAAPRAWWRWAAIVALIAFVVWILSYGLL